MKNISKKYLFYGFIALNIIAVIYLYFSDYNIDPEMLKAFLTTEYFLISKWTRIKF
jgi:hypothetical protein